MQAIIRKLKKSKTGFLFLIPWFLFFVIFTVYPFFYGFYISFFKYNFVNMKFIGLDNYTELFSSPMFLKAIGNTLKIFVLLVPSTIIVSLWVAKTIEKTTRRFQNFTKVIYYVHAVSSEVALVLVWRWMFSPAYGLSTAICNYLGISPIDWLGKPTNALLLVTGLVLTWSIAQPILLYSAALGSIPEQLYEAASIDGASTRAVFFRITLPLLAPTTVFVLITCSINSLQVFTIPYLMTSGGPSYSTTTILLMLYRSAFESSGRYGYASAIGVILFFLIAMIASIQFKLTKSTDIQY